MTGLFSTASYVVNRRAFLGLGVGAATLLGVSACSSHTEMKDFPTEAVRGGILEYGHDVQPLAGGIDPFVTTAFASQNIYQQIYQSLIRRDENGDYQPLIAEKWEQPTPSQWLFTLRQEAKFSNGEQVTPEDVVFSFETAKESGAIQAPYLAAMESVKAQGDNQVLFTLSRPSAAFINAVAGDMTGTIVNKKWYTSTTPEERERSALGSGPFKLEQWSDNIVLKLVRNEHYWEPDKPHLDGINYRIIPDEQARIAALRQGSVDAIWIGDQQLAEQVKDEGFTIGKAAETRSMFLYVNAEDGALQDLNFRRAVSVAMDRKQIAKLASYGYGKISTIVPVGDLADIKPDSSTPYYQHDKELARKLVKESGVDPTFTLTYPSDASFARDLPIYEIIKSQLAEVGIDVQLKALPWADVLPSAMQGNFQGLIAVPGTAYPDPSGYFNIILNPKSPRVRLGNQGEHAWLLSREADALTDPAERRAKRIEAANEVADKALVFIPFAAAQRQEIWSPVWKGYETDPWTYRHHTKDGWKVP